MFQPSVGEKEAQMEIKERGLGRRCSKTRTQDEISQGRGEL